MSSLVTQTYNVDIIPFGSMVVVPVSQFDVGARQLVFNIVNSQSPGFTIPSDATAVIDGMKPDGKAFEYPVQISGNSVTVNLTEQMTAVAGYTECEIAIMQGENRIATANFQLHVEASVMDDSKISDSDLSTITESAKKASESAAQAQDSAGKAANSASDAANSAKTAQTALNDVQSLKDQAGDSASQAARSASAAATSASNSATSEKNAKTSETNAGNSATAANTSATNAGNSATAAAGSAQTAAGSATDAKNSSDAAKAWAVGPSSNLSSGTDTANAKYYAEQAEESAKGAVKAYIGQNDGMLHVRYELLKE